MEEVAYKIMDFILVHWMAISLVVSISVNIGGVIMWFVKTRKYWHEGTEAKKRIQKMEDDKKFEDEVIESYRFIIESYENRKAKVGYGVRIKIGEEEIKSLFKQPLSLRDISILHECWKKILESKRLLTDDCGNFFWS
jgi:hypothetical protein